MHSHRKVAAHLARATGCLALVVDYRRAPEFPHPAPCEDALRAFRWLVGQGFPAHRIALAGDSAGGGLATATAVALRDSGQVMPAGIVVASPFYDMECCGASLQTRASVDVLVQQPVLLGMVGMFLGERSQTDPLANLLHADLHGLPPIMIVVGDHEVLLDDSVRFAKRAEAAGVEVILDVVPEMQHVFVLGAGKVPEADAAIAKFAQFLRPLLKLNS
jgi:acetyl esterase/lipase